MLVDGETVLSAALADSFQGQVGLVTVDSGGTYFDNVDVRFNR